VNGAVAGNSVGCGVINAAQAAEHYEITRLRRLIAWRSSWPQRLREHPAENARRGEDSRPKLTRGRGQGKSSRRELVF